MKRVAIIGVAQTSFEARKPGKTYADLAYEATTGVLEDARLSIGDVDNIVTVSNDFLDGRTISSMAVTDAVGAAFGQGKNISTVEGDGALGAFYGLSRILSGSYAATLVVAHSKASEGDRRLISNAFFDPIYERALGMDWITAAALQARACLDQGADQTEWAHSVARHRASGARNPKAHLRQAVSAQEVLNSKPLASPLKELEVAPLSDGAAALILADEDFAKKRGAKPIWIEAAAFCADARLTDRNLAESKALRQAAQRAYRMAGIREPAREIGVAEISCLFSYQESLWLRELGLGSLEKHRVNPSGGCFCANAEVACGLARMIEATLQLRQEAANGVPCEHALAHGQHGLCGQSHCVWILGKN